MAGPRIFYFGRNDSMMALVGQQLTAAGMDAHGFRDETVLAGALAKGDVRLLVMGAGVEDEPRERLRALCAAHDILFHEHFEGPTALVEHVTRLLA